MQQTETYKLNLIEPKDKFLPDALNENAQKLEAALSESDTRLTAAAQGLDTRLKAIELHRIAIGTYKAAANLSIEVGFKPLFVFIQSGTFLSGILFPEEYKNTWKGTITKTGFQIKESNTNNDINNPNHSYSFVAFG